MDCRATDTTGLDRIASSQQGLFTRTQARAYGYSAYQIRCRISQGRWRRVAGSVPANDGLVITPGLRDRAAKLTVAGSVLAGPAAARRWGVAVSDLRTFLLVAPHAHPRRVAAQLFFEHADQGDVQIFEGAAVTSRARTVFDCLRVLPRPEAVGMLDSALQQRWPDREDLAERVRAHVGRRGMPQLVELMRAFASGERSVA
jgi:Transcriptional regulator, AbiEi antitoxin